MNKTLNDFHSPMCLQCFPTQENLPRKTLNPKVTSFVFSSFSPKASPSKSAKKHLNSTQTQSKSCHNLPNRDTADAYDQPYPQNVSSKSKIVSRFPEIVSRLDTLQNMLTALQNRDTPSKSCHNLELSHLHNLKS